MKNLLYTLTLIALISSSCRNLEKMVERGDYDSAIIYAANKLSGKKNKRTQHVQGLEEAFARINQRDLDEITFLNGNENPQNWATIERIADNIARRQAHIEPLIPLVSKEGYEAHFDFVDTYAIKDEAVKGATEFYYVGGTTLLNKARKTKDKKLARQAFYNFEKALDRIRNYKDARELLEEAREAGTVHLKVEVVNNSRSYVPAQINERLEALNIYDLNRSWKRFYRTDVENIEFDNIAVLELNDIDVSPERETVTHHKDEKRVKDGFEYLKDKKGNIKTDSTGKKLKVDKFKTVHAHVTEIKREKAAYVSGYMKIYENENIISSRPLSVEAIFLDHSSRFRGDKRAICDHDRNRLRTHPEPFPHDFEIIGDATEKLKSSFLSAVSSVNI